jgi:hypothetical protein
MSGATSSSIDAGNASTGSAAEPCCLELALPELVRASPLET